MAISDLIANFILETLSDSDGVAELQRSNLAQKFNCVPSQINYVISTRFSPEHGYIVESRRGGGGYIRITRVRMDRKSLVMHTINAIGNEIDAQSASAFISNLITGSAIDERTSKLIHAAISEATLKIVPHEYHGALRASILKRILLNIL